MLGRHHKITLEIETLPIVRGLWCRRCHSHSRIRIMFVVKGQDKTYGKSVCANCD